MNPCGAIEDQHARCLPVGRTNRTNQQNHTTQGERPGPHHVFPLPAARQAAAVAGGVAQIKRRGIGGYRPSRRSAGGDWRARAWLVKRKTYTCSHKTYLLYTSHLPMIHLTVASKNVHMLGYNKRRSCPGNTTSISLAGPAFASFEFC